MTSVKEMTERQMVMGGSTVDDNDTNNVNDDRVRVCVRACVCVGKELSCYFRETDADGVEICSS